MDLGSGRAFDEAGGAPMDTLSTLRRTASSGVSAATRLCGARGGIGISIPVSAAPRSCGGTGIIVVLTR